MYLSALRLSERASLSAAWTYSEIGQVSVSQNKFGATEAEGEEYDAAEMQK